jgi:hypothetical protein
MAPPRANIDLPASLTASTRCTGTVPPTATSGSLSVPVGNAHIVSTETVRPSADQGDDGNNSAARKLALSDLLTMISREAKLTGPDHEPREQADERTPARQLQHPPNPVGAKTLIGPNEALHVKAVADTAAASQTSRATMFNGIGTTIGINLAGMSKTQIKKQLPPRWCMQCLACHPYPDKVGHHHIRSLRDNAAMHEAIRAGDVPPVDPWHDVLKDLKLSQPQAPQAQAPQPQEPRIRTATFEPTEEEAKMIKEEGDGSMNWLCEFVARKNEAIDRRNQAPQPQPQLSGSYANAAPAAFSSTYLLPGTQRMQPTGPPPRKRKHWASGNDQQSGHADGNARSKRRYRTDFRDSVLQRAQTPDGDDDQTVLETLQVNDVPENSTSSKMPQNDEAATAVNKTAASKKLT